MSNYFEIPQNSIVSSYGGIGSLIETPLGSMKILNLEKWPYYIYEIDGKDREYLDSISIHDPRLRQRLRHVFSKLNHLLKIPTNSTYHAGYRAVDDKNLISAEYFPKWMFCPKCNRFMRYEDWERRYQLSRIGKRFDMYCPECRKPSSGKSANILLEQVRFVSITENGEIADINWEDWLEEKNASENKCSKHELYYKNSAYGDQFESINIGCKKCNLRKSLYGLYGVNAETKARTVLKSSNSVYFPSIIRSLQIPVSKSNQDNSISSEMEYRCQEFDYIIRKSRTNDDDYVDKLYLKNMPSVSKAIKLISIRSLKMLSVLCSYTRLKPIQYGAVFDPLRSVHVTEAGLQTKFLPSIESLGEGFLLIFDDFLIRDWHNKALSSEQYISKVMIQREQLKKYGDMYFSGADDYSLCKYTLLHTISHLLIKQLEYSSGYPAASINERIFCSPEHHAGVMIYTVAGSEGSYGGIVSIVERGSIKQMLIEAIEKAMFCTNDPVCYTNTSVCYSCCLLPETTCEAFNTFLDRSFVVDKGYGFMNMML